MFQMTQNLNLFAPKCLAQKHLSQSDFNVNYAFLGPFATKRPLDLIKNIFSQKKIKSDPQF